MTMPNAPDIPSRNEPPFWTYATGIQLHACTAYAADPRAVDWTVKAPIADPWSEHAGAVWMDDAGPSWGLDDVPVDLKAVADVERTEAVGSLAITESCDAATADAERAADETADAAASPTGADAE